MNVYIMLLVVLILVIIVGCGFNCYIDYKQYNHGKCRYCDGKLLLIHYDLQGGRLYKCDRCLNRVWISWPVD